MKEGVRREEKIYIHKYREVERRIDTKKEEEQGRRRSNF